MPMKIKFIFLLLLIFNQISAQNPVEDFIENNLHQNASISLAIYDLDSKKMIANHRAKSVTVPASTLKVITTATALEILGQEFQFKTYLEIDGEIDKSGILHGNLFIRGGGDPTLGSSKLGDVQFLKKWANAVKKIGIKTINGEIIADETIFDEEGVNPKWTWEDIGNYYAAGAYGIAYKDNLYEISLHSGKIGTTPIINSVQPNIPNLILTNKLISSEIRFDSAYIYGAPKQNERIILGKIPANRKDFRIKGDIPDPKSLLISDFYKELEQSGIQIRKNEIVPKERRIIYTHFSPPLSEIIREINVSSNNLYAEHLFRYLGSNKNGISTTNFAIATIKQFWKDKKLPTEELFMVDGSGLSPMNNVSANFFINLLEFMEHSANKTPFLASFPVAGVNGTLKNFLLNTPLSNKVIAKSGSINRVKSYVGYIKTETHHLAFAILVNNPNSNSTAATTSKIEKLLVEVVNNLNKK